MEYPLHFFPVGLTYGNHGAANVYLVPLEVSYMLYVDDIGFMGSDKP